MKKIIKIYSLNILLTLTHLAQQNKQTNHRSNLPVSIKNLVKQDHNLSAIFCSSLVTINETAECSKLWLKTFVQL